MPRKVKTVKVYAKKPGMHITIDGTVYPFENGVLEVSQELAEQVKRHHLYRRDHIFFEEDAVVVEGKIQSMKNDPKLEEMKTAKKEDIDLVFFQFLFSKRLVVVERLAVQMVNLVLKHASDQSFAPDYDRLPSGVESFYLDTQEPRH